MFGDRHRSRPGVVIRGEPLRYRGGCAGDTGHIILEPGGPRCAMGCEGCAEALCGVAGIERLALERTGKEMLAQELITQAREGNREAEDVIDQIGEWIGLTLLFIVKPRFLRQLRQMVV